MSDGGHQVIHEFLYIPECPVPLLGRDLLSKLGAQVAFSPEERPTFQMDTMTYLLSLLIPPQDEWRLHEPPKEERGGPEEHESELIYSLRSRQKTTPYPPRMAKHQAPVITELKPGNIPVRKHQYPLRIEAWAGILPHINRLKEAGILVECQLAWNMPILPVKKEGGQDYRPVQDLRLVNQATVTLHPTVSNPYTLLSLLPLKTKVYTCLDLKDAFFCICLAPASQPIFAFEWEDPVGGHQATAHLDSPSRV